MPKLQSLVGGVSRSVPWNAGFVLDGSKSGNVGNIPGKLLFSWSCRLANASYPMATNFTSSGCFHNHSDVITNSSMLVVDAERLGRNNEYVFGLEVKEGVRRSYAHQNVFVLDGPVPSLDLRWVKIGIEIGGQRE